MKYVALIPCKGDVLWQVAEIGPRTEVRIRARANNPGVLVNVVSTTYCKRNFPDVWKAYELHLKARMMEEISNST